MSDFHINIVQLFLYFFFFAKRNVKHEKFSHKKEKFFILFLSSSCCSLSRLSFSIHTTTKIYTLLYVYILVMKSTFRVPSSSMSFCFFLFNFIINGDSLCVGGAITNNKTEFFHFLKTSHIACYLLVLIWKKWENTCWQHDSEHKF